MLLTSVKKLQSTPVAPSTAKTKQDKNQSKTQKQQQNKKRVACC
jgi:hypothetical protein